MLNAYSNNFFEDSRVGKDGQDTDIGDGHMVPVKHCQRRARGSRKAIKANPAARDSLIDREFPGWVRAFGGPL